MIIFQILQASVQYHKINVGVVYRNDFSVSKEAEITLNYDYIETVFVKISKIQ